MGLVRALQWCAEWSGALSDIFCSVIWDLCRCLEPLMERDNMLDASMLEVTGEEPVVSPTHTEEAVLLGEDPEPKEDQATTLHIPIQPEEASEPEDTISPGVMAADPQNVWRQILLSTPGFAKVLTIRSRLPPLEDADMPMRIPIGAWLDLTFLSSMQITILQNNITGELEYQYKARVITRMSLHLIPPDNQG